MSECSKSEPFALQVTDNSMEPEFPDKCIVLIEPVSQCSNGDHIFVEVEGVRWFRKYVEFDDGSKRLIAINDLYPEIDVSNLEMLVLGLIIQRNVRRKIKHYHPALQS